MFIQTAVETTSASSSFATRLSATNSRRPIVPAEPTPNRPLPGAGLLNALTIIAHDLRGPLTNLSLMIELIETQAQMRVLDKVATTSKKAQDLIAELECLLEGFLRRAQETGDPLSFKPARVDLAEVIRMSVALNQATAQSRNVTFDCSGIEPSVISGDRSLLREAVSNLVSNAVKYAPTGSTVTCSVAVDANEAVIKVQDEGQGLTEYDLKRAFRPFTTLSARYAGKGSSWGLGLWIVRLIAERHGGQVAAASHGTWRGSEFSLHLPVGGPAAS